MSLASKVGYGVMVGVIGVGLRVLVGDLVEVGRGGRLVFFGVWTVVGEEVGLDEDRTASCATGAVGVQAVMKTIRSRTNPDIFIEYSRQRRFKVWQGGHRSEDGVWVPGVNGETFKKTTSLINLRSFNCLVWNGSFIS